MDYKRLLHSVKGSAKAVEEAELMAGVEITNVYTGIAGGHIKSFNSTGVVAVKDKEITEKQMKNIATDDIESISVLKDKSATELYGEKGKNGVVIIHLKENVKTLK